MFITWAITLSIEKKDVEDFLNYVCMFCNTSMVLKTKTNVQLPATANFTCIVPETAPVQKSQVLVVEILQGQILLLLEAGNKQQQQSRSNQNVQKMPNVQLYICLL